MQDHKTVLPSYFPGPNNKNKTNENKVFQCPNVQITLHVQKNIFPQITHKF